MWIFFEVAMQIPDLWKAGTEYNKAVSKFQGLLFVPFKVTRRTLQNILLYIYNSQDQQEPNKKPGIIFKPHVKHVVLDNHTPP